MRTPLRRLEGITYWVIEDPNGIYDFVTTEIRKEWEADATSEGRDPKNDPWLTTLLKRKWSLEIIEISRIRLNPDLMTYVNNRSDYNFAKHLAKRSDELQREIKEYSMVIWPIIIRKEDSMLIDGYCRYATLKAMNVSRTYAYVGAL
jgi:hypothetical protein